jgi:hypothetical protein
MPCGTLPTPSADIFPATFCCRGMLPTSLADMLWLRRQIRATAASVWAAATQPSAHAAAAGAAPGHCSEGGGSSGRGPVGGGSCDGDACGGGAPEQGRFRPNLIVANQLAYGQAHCAEALGVPLHMIYTVGAAAGGGGRASRGGAAHAPDGRRAARFRAGVLFARRDSERGKQGRRSNVAYCTRSAGAAGTRKGGVSSWPPGPQGRPRSSAASPP